MEWLQRVSYVRVRVWHILHGTGLEMACSSSLILFLSQRSIFLGSTGAPFSRNRSGFLSPSKAALTYCFRCMAFIALVGTYFFNFHRLIWVLYCLILGPVSHVWRSADENMRSKMLWTAISSRVNCSALRAANLWPNDAIIHWKNWDGYTQRNAVPSRANCSA